MFLQVFCNNCQKGNILGLPKLFGSPFICKTSYYPPRRDIVWFTNVFVFKDIGHGLAPDGNERTVEEAFPTIKKVLAIILQALF